MFFSSNMHYTEYMKVSARSLWWIITSGSIIGLISSLIQTIERINYALNPKVALSCDINAIFSCSNVFDAWQSRVFGFSNSLVCMMFFALTAGLALAAATGSDISRKIRYIFHFMSVFFLGFGVWYLWQSTYQIGFICIFCLFCYSAVIIMNWAWFRLHYLELPLKNNSVTKLNKFLKNGGDLFIAILWALAVATMIITHFW